MRQFAALVIVLALMLPGSRAFGFRDDFNTLDTSVWEVHANGGKVSISDGKLVVSAPGTSHSRFPVLRTKANPFLLDGDIIVRVCVRFTELGHTTGVMGWGSYGSSIGVQASSQTHTEADTTYHEYEWDCYAGGHIEYKVDGRATKSWDLLKWPVYFEIGNHAVVPGGTRWTSLEIDYIEVVPATLTATPTAQPEPAPQSAQYSAGKSDADALNSILMFAAIAVIIAIQFVKDKKTQAQLAFALVGIALLTIMANVGWNPLVAILCFISIGVVATIYILVLRFVVRGVAHVVTAPRRAQEEERAHWAEVEAEIDTRQAKMSNVVEEGFRTPTDAQGKFKVVVCQECGAAYPVTATECPKCHQKLAESQSTESERGGNQTDVLS